MKEPFEPRDAKVLIVDDTLANLDLLRDILKPLGVQIFFATGGAMALEIAARVRPDLILLDVMMPDMDGLETCRRLKAMETFSATPVIFVTAKTELEDLIAGFGVGGADYITKPVKEPEVHARVKAHLQIQGLIKQQQINLVALEHTRRELQELNATKDRFLSSIGRTLRDSLAEIAAASAALKGLTATSQTRREEVGQTVDDINRSAATVLSLLENILEWPRIQAGQKLDLLGMDITDRDLGYLVTALDSLRFLSLAKTRITDAGLMHLKGLKDLQELHLDGTAITDAGLDLLADLQGLQILDLKDTKITDSGLARLRPLQRLKGLYLTRTQISDAGLAHLGTLLELQTLILWGTRISDAGLHHLQTLSRLRELILWETQVSIQGADRVRTSLPGCDVSTAMFATK